MGAHAVRNASGSKRWMNCPGSINLAASLSAKGVIKPTSSHYARLGTAAHGLCEESLRLRRHPTDFIGGLVYLDMKEDAHVIAPEDLETDTYKVFKALAEGQKWEAFPIDANMADAVSVYYDTIMGDLDEMGPMAELSVERRFNLNWVIGYDFDDDAWEADPSYVSPSGITYVFNQETERHELVHADGRPCHGPMFGTNDASILLPFDLLRVYDYKHGQGVIVEVEDNSQELYYALGIAREVDWCFSELELVIIQPRAAHADGPVRRWRCTAERLRAFEEELRQAAIATEDPDAPLKAGDHCGFCPGAAYCSSLRDKAFEVACLEFQAVTEGSDVIALTSTDEPGPLTTEDDLRTAMEAIPMLDAFIKSVETEALRRLREAPGGQAFGHKLVRKRSIRAWRKDLVDVQDTDEGQVEVPVEAVELLVSMGFPREDLYEQPKLKGPAKVEALRPAALIARLKGEGVKAPVGAIKQMVAELSHKPEGGITIAHESDPRPAVDPTAAALSDFEAVEEDTPAD